VIIFFDHRASAPAQLSQSWPPTQTAAVGHEGWFPPRRLSARCRLGKATFGGTHGNEKDVRRAGLSKHAKIE
jgi:hypothetical protein